MASRCPGRNRFRSLLGRLLPGALSVGLLASPLSPIAAATPPPEPVPTTLTDDVGSGRSLPMAGTDELPLAVGTTDGVEVLTPNPPSSGGFRPIARLWVAGWDAPAWTDYECTTGDGRFMALTFAPTAFTNDWALQSHGAFGAVVDLRTGGRWILPTRVSLEYHTPGCGLDDRVVFSTDDRSTDGTVSLTVVDAARSVVLSTLTTHSDITSAVPLSGTVVAAQGGRLVRVEPSGDTEDLATTPGQLYDLHPNSQGGVDALSVAGEGHTSIVSYVVGHGLTVAGSGPLQATALFGGRNGRNVLTGDVTGQLGAFRVIHVSKPPLAVSLDGSALVSSEVLPGVNALYSTSQNSIGVASAMNPDQPQLSEVATPAGSAPLAADVPNAAGVSTTIPKASPSATNPNVASAPLTTSSPGPVGTSTCAVAPLDPNTQVISLLRRRWSGRLGWPSAAS